jgi:hypothetical protein
MPPRSLSVAIALGALVAAPAGSAQAATLHLQPGPGERLYRYELEEAQGDKRTGYHVDLRLRTERGGGTVATVLRAAETQAGATGPPVTPSPDCAQAMHAPPGALAQVRLHPLDPERAKLGETFIAFCAPRAVFFPITDILNVVLIQQSDQFAIRRLAADRRSAIFPGFSTRLSRPDFEMAETSQAGEIALAGVEGGQALVDWKPSPSHLEITQPDAAGPGKPVVLRGEERYAIRLTIDAATGVLERAETLYDDLDLNVSVPGAPPGGLPRVQIRRRFVLSRQSEPAT